jgi:KipI family sensor histidine kinase inhibitor
MNWVSYGPRALLFRFADRVGNQAFARSRALVTELKRHPPPGLLELVPAFTSILLEFDPTVVPDPAQIAEQLTAQMEKAAKATLPPGPIKEIPVRYDGEDLAHVAQAKQLSIQQVCSLHSTPRYKVYALGFAPGFPYLGELDPRLHTPRRASPRPIVRAGSVAIGGEHTGIYTVDSPGGWHIIGHTPLMIFDPTRGAPNGPDEAMFLLQPGDRVKFIPIH